MSNARLRSKLDVLTAPTIAAAIDQGHVHDDGGILEFDYHGYCNPGEVIKDAVRATRLKEAAE